MSNKLTDLSIINRYLVSKLCSRCTATFAIHHRIAATLPAWPNLHVHKEWLFWLIIMRIFVFFDFVCSLILAPIVAMGQLRNYRTNSKSYSVANLTILIVSHSGRLPKLTIWHKPYSFFYLHIFQHFFTFKIFPKITTMHSTYV